MARDRTEQICLEDLPPLRGAAVSRLLLSRIAAASDDVQRIIESAYRVIAREPEPDFALKMRDIVEESGMSTQSFYRLFGSKDEFILILLEHGSKTFESRLVDGLAGRSDPVDRIIFWIRAVLSEASDSAAADRARPFIAHIPRLKAVRPAAIEQMRRGIIGPLRDAITEFSAADGRAVDEALIAELIYEMTYYFMNTRVLARRPANSTDQDAVVTACLQLIGVADRAD